MTNPASFTRSALLRGCAPAALTLAGMALPQAASAQAFQGTATVVQGTVSIDRTTPNVDTIQVTGFDAVIDWTRDEISGVPLTFLPSGNTAVFRGGVGDPGFAVLNRIQPTSIPAPADFAGTVQAFIQAAAGGPLTPGGFVAFYSPTGILISGTAVFEVPQLMLTTNDVDIASFTDFATGAGPLLLSGNNSQINIQSGASLTGTPEDSFFIVSSTGINMGGDAYFNGSTAYVAAFEAQLSHSSGLFDIVIPFGGGVEGNAIFHSGSTGGPSSTGAGDNHVIYGVTQAAEFSTSGVSMLFFGNLGFDPAVSAGVINGDIILSANHDVSGLQVDGASIREGINARFDGRTEANTNIADIFLSSLTATSSVLAITTGEAIVNASESSSSFSDDLLLVGRQLALVEAEFGGSVDVGGDLLISARDYGQNGDVETNDAVAGVATLRSGSDGQVTVTGSTLVTSDAIPGTDIGQGLMGSATAGQAQIFAEGGLIDFTGAVTVSAEARQDVFAGIDFSGDFTGGSAVMLVDDGSLLTLRGALTMNADATSPDLTGNLDQAGANATAGTVLIGTGQQGGNLQVDGNVELTANATAGSGVLAVGSGGTATGGSIGVFSLGGGDMQFTLVDGGNVTFRAEAEGNGGDITGGGDGGAGVGGSIDFNADIANLRIAGSLQANAIGRGGSGFNGGAGSTSGVGISAANNSTVLLGSAFLISSGVGGIANGGTGGIGTAGLSAVTVTDSSLTANLGLSLFASGSGGNGNSSGGDGQGGNSILLIDNGTVDLGSTLIMSATGSGGNGTDGDPGGTGTGGLSQIEILGSGNLIVPDTSTGVLQSATGSGGDAEDGAAGAAFGGDTQFLISEDSVANLGRLGHATPAFGGDSNTGAGGAATGGSALVDITLGSAVTVDGGLFSLGGIVFGGDGATGGDATGGDSTLAIDSSSSFSSINFAGVANSQITATGGTGLAGDGGNAVGGSMLFQINGGQLNFSNSQVLDVRATGGESTGGTGGSAFGGQVQIINDGGTITAANTSTIINASGTGGTALSPGQAAGDGTGGDAAINTLLGANSQFGSITMIARGTGGSGVDAIGGAGQGGDLGLLVSGDGASLTTNGAQLLATGTGGESTATGATGGSGNGGFASILVDGAASLQSTFTLTLDASATGGDGTATGGDATAGSVELGADTGGIVSGTNLTMRANGTGGAASDGTGGLATGGFATLQAQDIGTQVSLSGTLSQQGFGSSFTGGDAFGGDLAVSVGTGADLQVTGTTTLNTTTVADGSSAAGVGGDAHSGTGLISISNSTAGFSSLEIYNTAEGGANNTAGRFDLLATAGSIDTDQFIVEQLGDTGPATPSSISADSGAITIANLADIDLTGDLDIAYANGGSVLGGSGPDTLSATFNISADGTISISGDDATDRFFASQFMTLTSRDINVGAQARFGADDLSLESLDVVNTNVLGGTTNGPGYTLTQQEFDQITATSLSVTMAATPNSIDAEVRDLDVLGSLVSDLTELRVFSNGTMAVLGTVDFSSAASTDGLRLEAQETLQVVLPLANISMTDGDGAPVGELALAGNSIIIADTDSIGLFDSDPDSVALATALATETGGGNSPISAPTVGLFANEYLYGQNTGEGGVRMGILVAPGGLTVEQIDASGIQLKTQFYAASDDGSALTTDEVFFDEAIASNQLNADFTTDATLNDCLIVAGSPCSSLEEPVPGTPPNHTLLEEPLKFEKEQEGRDAVPTTASSDEYFGVDFPALFDAPIILEDERVNDPVTSGGDSALYNLGQGRTPARDDNEGGEE